jgi:predicted ester cyclase
MTHTGDHLGMPATNKKVRITGSTMIRIEKGKIVEGWDNWDQLALMQQINSSSASAASYSNRTVHLR